MTPETLEDRIKRHEGLRLRPYLDSLGHYTIGYGHEITSTEALMYKEGVTLEWASETLQADIQSHRDALLQALPWMTKIDPVREDVFVELCFNLGLAGLLAFHRTLTDAEDGMWVKCSVDLLLSKWATQVKGRAVELAQIIRTGQPGPSIATPSTTA
jgi:lysozyme